MESEIDHSSLVRRLLASVSVPSDDRLEFGRELDRGGAGVIRSIRDRVLRRELAAKVMHDDMVDDPLFLHGFLREAQVTAQLTHPNIVPIHELGFDGSLPYITMSRVDGKGLNEWIASRRDRLDYTTVIDFLEIMLKVCDALEFAHARGVIHCDLKPDNIMVGEFGQVYLMDWGGAQLDSLAAGGQLRVEETLPEIPAETRKGKVFGTLEYMAPERARGLPVDARSDVFSMGAILYEFTEGRPPFEDEDLVLLAKRVRCCEIPPIDPSRHGDLIPRELYRVTARALSGDPGQRQQSIAELRADLAQLARGGGDFPTLRVAAGTRVIREGDAGDAAFIIVAGSLEVSREVEGKTVRLRELGPGDVFGETAIFAESPRTADVVAVTEATLVRITEDVIRHELDLMKPWMAAFVRTVAERFRERETEQLKDSSAGKRRWWRRGRC